MWPLLLDMTKEESVKNLRCLELEAYSSLVTALRAQGPLSQDKLKLLKETCTALNISTERHKAEIRRAVNDEKLNTIAYYVSGQVQNLEDWVQEGRRLIPLLQRMPPQTAYSVIADENADTASLNNKQLPLPAATERKRPLTQTSTITSEINKPLQFRLQDNKQDDVKKRKYPFCTENSSLAQHLMGAPKVSRIQQIYRQRTKAKMKEQQLQMKLKQEQEQHFHSLINPPKLQYKLPLSPQPSTNAPKINIIQNIGLSHVAGEGDNVEQIKKEVNLGEVNRLSPQPSCSNENQAPKCKQLTTNLKATQSMTFKQIPNTLPCSSGAEVASKSFKLCTSRKTLTPKTTAGQKLIVVSSAQSIASNSILQHTLTIPFVKNLSVKNLDKFKIVTTASTNLSALPAVITNANTFTTNSVKHKVVTVRTNATPKKVIPFSQLQLINAKGGIKVLPLGGKIVTKTTVNTTSSLYIVNSSIQALTKSTPSTPLIMTCKADDNTTVEIKNQTNDIDARGNVEIKADEEKPANIEAKDEVKEDSDGKSSILADILKASGVTVSDSETFVEDIESRISQITELPQNDNILSGDEVQLVSVDGENAKIGADEQVEDVNGCEEKQDQGTNEEYSENFVDGECTDAKSIEDHKGDFIIIDEKEEDPKIIEYENEECVELSPLADMNCVDHLNEQYSIEVTTEQQCVEENLDMGETIILEDQNFDMPDLTLTN